MFRPRTGLRRAGWGCHNGYVGVTAGLVTLLFTDIEGGVRLWEADRDVMAAASARHGRMVREQIEASGGQVFKTVGEAHRAVFADPVAALSSAVAIQRAAGGEPWPSGLPIGVCMALRSGACGDVRAARRPAARRDRAPGPGRAAAEGPGARRAGLSGDRIGPGRRVRRAALARRSGA